MFGSSLQYILKSYSNEFEPITNASILRDGSMHSYTKQHHWASIDEIVYAYRNGDISGVSTPIYPFEDNDLPEIIDTLKPFLKDTDSKILIYSEDINFAEINLLFQYHKIVVGQATTPSGWKVFFDKVGQGYKSWNPNYTSWQDMQPWQMREWLSLFYPELIQKWIDSQHQVDKTFLKISNKEILDNTLETLSKIFDFCNLTPTQGLSTFLTKWRAAQQYVLDEHALILQIIDAVDSNVQIQWQPLNLTAEAIIQQRFRALGYEIRCDGLNVFPTDSQTLYNLLEKV
jgi:hypothetical protein